MVYEWLLRYNLINNVWDVPMSEWMSWINNE
jgi:hypothetical protein